MYRKLYRFVNFVMLLACLSWAIPSLGQEGDAGCESALKNLRQSKKLTKLPYVCPKQLGAQLQAVLTKLRDQTQTVYGNYQFQKAVLHIETGSTTEIDAGVNLVVFTISYKHKKGLTQSMDSVFSLPDKKALTDHLDRLQALSKMEMSDTAAAQQQTAEDKLAQALNDAIDVASQVTILPTDSVVAKVQFSISNDINAGVSFVFLGGSSKASAGVDFTKTSVNSIEVTFKPKPEAKPSN
jgi:hypothetical protein